jgi:hypothetical protein
MGDIMLDHAKKDADWQISKHNRKGWLLLVVWLVASMIIGYLER